MAIVLDALVLPSGLIWIDEFDWTPVEQVVTQTLTGALIIESGVRQAGRPITLTGSADSGWADRALIKALATKAADPILQMTLTLHDARTFTVMFLQSKTPVEARLLIDYNAPDDTDAYTLILRLIQV
ncbi:MAG: hypothetical protein PHR16_14080 [Methylovulum sp.]|nr:hypothetical protein [Methylovulum sp.]